MLLYSTGFLLLPRPRARTNISKRLLCNADFVVTSCHHFALPCSPGIVTTTNGALRSQSKRKERNRQGFSLIISRFSVASCFLLHFSSSAHSSFYLFLFFRQFCCSWNPPVGETLSVGQLKTSAPSPPNWPFLVSSSVIWNTLIIENTSGPL